MGSTNPLFSLNKQFINGEWREGRGQKVIEDRNPFDGALITTVKSASAADTNEAFEIAHQAQLAWRDTLPAARRDLLLKAAAILEEKSQQFAEVIIQETGSSFAKAGFEVHLVANMLKEFSSFPTRAHGSIVESNIPGKRNFSIREPLGVVGVISPFNFPLILSMRAIAPAIALGNAVVVKPDRQTLITGGLMIAKLFEEAGLPAGVLNVVVGDTAEMGNAFTAHEHLAKLCFTGSTEVGKILGRDCGANLKHVSLELGGNNPIIVLEDADLELAVNAAIFGRFLHQGQICMSANRILVHESLYDAFAARFVEKAKKIQAGDPRDPHTIVGPLINANQAQRVRRLVDASVAAGATVALEGRIEGCLVSPFVLTNVRADMACIQEEVFGPVASLIKFKTEDEAFAIANDTKQNLTSSIFTRNTGRAFELARKLKAGMVHINDQSVNDESHMLFGGRNEAGMGQYGGEWAIHEFSAERWLSIQEVAREYFPV